MKAEVEVDLVSFRVLEIYRTNVDGGWSEREHERRRSLRNTKGASSTHISCILADILLLEKVEGRHSRHLISPGMDGCMSIGRVQYPQPEHRVHKVNAQVGNVQHRCCPMTQSLYWYLHH